MNTATSQALQDIPEWTRSRLKDHRRATIAKSLDELQKVHGIKAKKYAQLRPS